jgi:transposase
MSTSLLYQGFGIVGYRYLRTLFKKGSVFFKITQDRSQLRCSNCNSRNVIGKGKRMRTFRSLPIGGKPTFIYFEVPRVRCFDCGSVRQVKIRLADFRPTYTQAFERYVLDLPKHMTIYDVSRHLKTSWDSYTIKSLKIPKIMKAKPTTRQRRRV